MTDIELAGASRALEGAPATFKSSSYKGLEFKGQSYTIQVAPEDCTGCNLCSHVCPVADCITMVDVTGGKPFESWNDRIAKGTAKVPGGLHD